MSFALLNIAHKDLQCTSQNGLPAFRLMGFFPSKEHAYKHLQSILKRKLVDPIGFFAIETFSNFVIPSTADRTSDYLTNKAKALYELQQHKNKDEKNMFKKRLEVKQREEGEFQRMLEEKEKRAQERDAFLSQPLEDADSFVSRDAEVRSQRYAAVGFINDPDTTLNEPLVCVYGGFDQESTCVRYIEDTLSDEVDEITLYCVEMYQWLYPTITANKGLMEDVPKSYRHQELNNWIKGKETNKQLVKEFYKNSKKPLEEEEGFGVSESKC